MLKTEIETIFSFVQIFTGLIYKVIDLFIYLYTWAIGQFNVYLLIYPFIVNIFSSKYDFATFQAPLPEHNIGFKILVGIEKFSSQP